MDARRSKRADGGLCERERGPGDAIYVGTGESDGEYNVHAGGDETMGLGGGVGSAASS